MKYCPNCGNPTQENSNFCINCGQQLKPLTQETSIPSRQVESHEPDPVITNDVIQATASVSPKSKGRNIARKIVLFLATCIALFLLFKSISSNTVKQSNVTESKADYISSCISLDYQVVERNPNTYEGKRIWIKGKVIQVSEGWNNSVTLRVEEDDGNIWYVKYTRQSDSESRILEDDVITFYGECTGVTSYKTILGSTITIPSMKAVYYK